MRRGGFTLVEVLVSLAIFALAAVVLSAAYTNVLLARQAMRQLDIEDEAFTRSRAALLETAGLEDAKAGGEIDLSDGRKARWSSEIEPTQVGDLFSATLTVEVAEASGASQPPRMETAYLLRPSWSVSGDRAKLTDAARERLRRLRPFEGTSTLDLQATGGGRGGSGGGRGQGGGGQGGGRDSGGPGGEQGGGRNGGPGPEGGGPGARPPSRGGNNQGGAGGAPRAP